MLPDIRELLEYYFVFTGHPVPVTARMLPDNNNMLYGDGSAAGVRPAAVPVSGRQLLGRRNR
eukprot:7926683-Pyramimonas_sp.AAC.1